MGTRGLGLMALVLIGATAVGAQRGAAPDAQPREARPPNPLGQPLLDASGHPRDDAFIRLPLQAADRAYGDLDGFRMKAYVNEVAAISRDDRERTGPRGFWGRNQATPGHVATQDWVERYFSAGSTSPTSAASPSTCRRNGR